MCVNARLRQQLNAQQRRRKLHAVPVAHLWLLAEAVAASIQVTGVWRERRVKALKEAIRPIVYSFPCASIKEIRTNQHHCITSPRNGKTRSSPAIAADMLLQLPS